MEAGENTARMTNYTSKKRVEESFAAELQQANVFSPRKPVNHPHTLPLSGQRIS
jgi:hypothetical protein